MGSKILGVVHFGEGILIYGILPVVYLGKESNCPEQHIFGGSKLTVCSEEHRISVNFNRKKRSYD